MEKITSRLNTVQTVLSANGVGYLECILYWFSDNIISDEVVRNLMEMFRVYIRHEPKDSEPYLKADQMAEFIRKLIELKDQLNQVVELEKPWEWVETTDGWELPEQSH